ncbi:MAG: DUF6660 family protein [Flammeovirgaceae bacterium]
MKHVTFILSLLIFVMSVLPCSDPYTFEETSVILQSEHDHSEDATDFCSPFCTCACCGVNVNINPQSYLNDNQPQHQQTDTYLFTYTFHYSFSFVEQVWHPPILV